MKQILGIATTLLLVISVPVLAEKAVPTTAMIQVADAGTPADQMNGNQNEKAGDSSAATQEKAKSAKKVHKAKKQHKVVKKAEHKKVVHKKAAKKAKHVKKVEARDSEKAKSDTTDSNEAPKE